MERAASRGELPEAVDAQLALDLGHLRDDGVEPALAEARVLDPFELLAELG